MSDDTHRRVKGREIERRGQVKVGSTTDQRLLDSRGPTDWVHTDPWRSVTADPLALGVSAECSAGAV